MPEDKLTVQDDRKIQVSQPVAITDQKPMAIMQQPSPSAVTFAGYVKDAGLLKVTDDQAKILLEPVDEKDIEIRPDGILYASWQFYKAKLDKAFPFRWRIIPLEPKPAIQNGCVLWVHYLIIDNAYVATAVGQCEYRENNPSISYGDAIEGCISNAITRLAKRMGINAELWSKKYIESWKEKYAEKYDDKGKMRWRKKSPEDIDEDKKVASIRGALTDKFAANISFNPISRKQIEKIHILADGQKLSRKDNSYQEFLEIDEVAKVIHNKKSSKDMTKDEAGALIDILDGISEGRYTIKVSPEGKKTLEIPSEERI